VTAARLVGLTGILVTAAGTSTFAVGGRSIERHPATDVAREGYRVVYGWPVLPDDSILDEVSAVAVDSHDHVFVLTRGGRAWPDTGALDQTPTKDRGKASSICPTDSP